MSGDNERLARLAERAACAAAAYLARVPRPAPDDWALKGPSDFVTTVDRTAEAMIRDDLRRAEPDSRVLGEELAPAQGDGAGLVWIVDPLDGTTNFLHGYPAWSVSIGAAIDGELVAGTVLHVATRACCLGWRDGGAWLGGDRLHVSGIRDPRLALLGTGFPFKTPGDMPRFLTILPQALLGSSGVRRAGSAALDLADVARGRLDAFWELTLAPWDVAAGLLLIREAGGVATDLDGAAARPARGGVVAGNPWIHEWLLRMVQASGGTT